MGQESTTRRNFILVSSAQALFALNASGALGQSTQREVAQANSKTLDGLLKSTGFSAANNFYEVFQRLWSEKVSLALATVETEAEVILSDLANRAQSTLGKEYGTDNPIPDDRLREVLAGTIFVQNILIGISTDVATGIVKITVEKLKMAQQYYCSHYPYCK